MKFLVAGAVLLIAGIIAAVILNYQGISCLTQLAATDSSAPTDSLAVLERDCFIITNSYVYSLFAAVAGGILLTYWNFRRRRP